MRIRAVTILELVVIMALIGIVSGFAWVGLRNTYFLENSIEGIENEISDFQLFKTDIQAEIDRAQVVVYKQDTLHFFPNTFAILGGSDFVLYTFNGTRSYKVQLVQSTEKGLLSDGCFIFNSDNQEFNYCFAKSYSTADYLLYDTKWGFQ